jgi:hypothetical protein
MMYINSMSYEIFLHEIIHRLVGSKTSLNHFVKHINVNEMRALFDFPLPVRGHWNNLSSITSYIGDEKKLSKASVEAE